MQEKYDAVKKDGPTPWFKGHFNTPANTSANTESVTNSASNADADSVRGDDDNVASATDTNA
ncbi:MAG: hypothetical protein R3Y11_01835 [Pseudomonadota bacterium]